MAKYLSPVGSRAQFFDNDGKPLAGGWFTAFQNGTDTLQEIFSDEAGTPLINPFQLDSSGNVPTEIWFTGGLTYKLRLQSEDLSVTRWEMSDLVGINDVTTIINNSTPVWIPDVGGVYLAANKVSVPGNQSSIYHVNRRVRVLQLTGYVYGTITAVAVVETSPGVFVTNVTLLMDSTPLDPSVSEVAYSILDSENTAVPADPALQATLASLQAQITALDATVASLTTTVNSSVPIGTIQLWSTNTPTLNWMACDGSAISRTTYANLFAIIGTTYGVGNGSTTFNLPDLRGKFARGWDNGAGVDPARTFGSSQTDSLQNIIGYLGVDDRIQGGGPNGATAGAFRVNATTKANALAAGAPNLDTTAEGGDGVCVYAEFNASWSSGARTSNETRPVNVALLYQIRVL